MENKIDEMLNRTLEEDAPSGDVSSQFLFDKEMLEVSIIALEDGIVSGIDYVKRLFTLINPNITVKIINHNGMRVEAENVIAILYGNALDLLKGCHVALNLLKRMSGIATLTKSYVEAIKNTDALILDSRHTTPLFRWFEKRAVVDGGGINHRFSLSDQVVLDAVHIKQAGSITSAVRKAVNHTPETVKIEVVVNTLEEYKEAVLTKADIIRLNNMPVNMMESCIAHNHDKLLTTCGKITLNNIERIALTGVDFIIVTTLTEADTPLNITLKFL
ncbi:MAG: carboxylating nicotinate-nucleotide diphosphorylase [Candidatus Izimaplasma sp.]|nr:carboxylating nicotinate-nucleotide diphosphorylase [Candidatus Izimaplasma bacterium]